MLQEITFQDNPKFQYLRTSLQIYVSAHRINLLYKFPIYDSSSAAHQKIFGIQFFQKGFTGLIWNRHFILRRDDPQVMLSALGIDDFPNLNGIDYPAYPIIQTSVFRVFSLVTDRIPDNLLHLMKITGLFYKSITVDR